MKKTCQGPIVAMARQLILVTHVRKALLLNIHILFILKSKSKNQCMTNFCRVPFKIGKNLPEDAWLLLAYAKVQHKKQCTLRLDWAIIFSYWSNSESTRIFWTKNCWYIIIKSHTKMCCTLRSATPAIRWLDLLLFLW